MSQATALRTELFRRLRPIRRRLRARQVLINVERAIPLAALVGIGLGATRILAGVPAAGIITAVVLAPLLAAAVWGLIRPIDWNAAARAVDDRYALADRTLSALANVRGDGNFELSGLVKLQVRDALRCLEPTLAAHVVELRASGRNIALLVVLALSLAVDGGTGPLKTANRPRTDGRPPGLAAPPRLGALAAHPLTQPWRLGLPAGPLALQERKEDSYLGDNAAVGRYFELLEHPAAAAQRPR